MVRTRRSQPPLDPDLYVADPELHVTIDVGLEPNLRPGRGSTYFLTGRCWHEHKRVVALEWWQFPDRTMTPIEWCRLRRPDQPTDESESSAVRRRQSLTGFAGLVDVAGVTVPTPTMFVVRAVYDDETSGAVPVGHHLLEPPLAAPVAVPTPRVDLAIVLPTFEPRPDLFERQIASIRAQSREDWVCLVVDDGSAGWSFEQILRTVGDDPRFVVVRNEQRLGFYRNFERALRLVPTDVELVALSDQDDVWHVDKLATLEKAVEPSVLMATSDCRVVNDHGDEISPTFYVGRAAGVDDLDALLVSNTVPSASMLIRRKVLDDALPFPSWVGLRYHDHWLALVARALGPVTYVDEPLYDYVQHGANSVGWGREPTTDTRSFTDRVADAVDGFSAGREWYWTDTVRVRQAARTLLLRGGDRIASAEQRTLDARADLGPGVHTIPALIRRARRQARRRDLVLDWERRALWGTARATFDRLRMRTGIRPVSWDGIGPAASRVHELHRIEPQHDVTPVFVRTNPPTTTDVAGAPWFPGGVYVTGDRVH